MYMHIYIYIYKQICKHNVYANLAMRSAMLMVLNISETSCDRADVQMDS